MRAFDATSGALRWDIGAIGALDTVAYAEGIVYVGTFKGRLVALRVSDGTEAWSMQLVMSGIVEAPAVAGGVVFAQFSSPPYGPHGVGAYHATTGEQLWTAATSVPGGGGISVANGVVYVSLRQQLKVLDARTGTSLLDIRHSSGAAIANGHVYVNAAAVPGDRSAGLYAYGLPKHPS